MQAWYKDKILLNKTPKKVLKLYRGFNKSYKQGFPRCFFSHNNTLLTSTYFLRIILITSDPSLILFTKLLPAVPLHVIISMPFYAPTGSNIEGYTDNSISTHLEAR